MIELAIKQKELIYRIIKERLAYHSPLLPFGEKVEIEKKIAAEIKQLNSEERHFLKKEIERIQFERIKSWFETCYR